MGVRGLPNEYAVLCVLFVYLKLFACLLCMENQEVSWDWTSDVLNSLKGSYSDFNLEFHSERRFNTTEEQRVSFVTYTGKFNKKELYFVICISPMYKNHTDESKEKILYFIFLNCSYNKEKCTHGSFIEVYSDSHTRPIIFCPANLESSVESQKEIVSHTRRMLDFFESMDDGLFRVLTVKMLYDINQLMQMPWPVIIFNDFMGEWYVTYTVSKSTDPGHPSKRLLSFSIAPCFSGSDSIINEFTLKILPDQDYQFHKSTPDPDGTKQITVQSVNEIIGTIREYANVYDHIYANNGHFKHKIFSALNDRSERIKLFSWLSNNFERSDVKFPAIDKSRVCLQCSGSFPVSGLFFLVRVEISQKQMCCLTFFCGDKSFNVEKYDGNVVELIEKTFNGNELVSNMIEIVTPFKELSLDLLSIMTAQMSVIWSEHLEIQLVYFHSKFDWAAEYSGLLRGNLQGLKVVVKCFGGGKILIKALRYDTREKYISDGLTVYKHVNPTGTKVAIVGSVDVMVKSCRSLISFGSVDYRFLYSKFDLLGQRIGIILAKVKESDG